MALTCTVACTHTQVTTAPSMMAREFKEESRKIRPVWHRTLVSSRACFGSLFSGTAKSNCTSWSGRQRSGPLADENMLYIGSWDGTLKKLSVDTGIVMTSIRLPSRVSATPTLHGDKLFVGLENGMLMCLNKHTLQRMWEKPQQLDADITQQPFVWGDTVYALTGDSSLYAMSVDNGHIVWRKRRPMENLVMMSQSRPLVLPGSAMQRSLMLVGNREGAIEVYDAQDGNLMFHLPVEQQEKPLRDIVAGPIVADNSIVAASVSGMMRAWRQPGFEEDWSVEESGLTHLAYDDVNKHVIAAGAGKI
ncbi:MAG: PQQ-binding-like beta-propeller repeat protein, partial [Myxococcota bacterium]